MAQNFYVRIQGRVLGPFQIHQLISMRDRGQLKQFHEVSSDQRNWHPAGDFPELFDGGAGTAPRREAAPPVPPRRPTRADEAESPVAPPYRARPVDYDDRTYDDPRDRRDEYDRPRGGTPWVLIVALIVLVVGGAALTIVLTTGGKKDDAQAKREGGNNGTAEVVSGFEESKLARAIGRVICGMEVVRVDGSIVEIPRSSGTSFAVSPDGYLLTNVHVVKEIDDLPRSAEIRKVNAEGKGTITPKLWVFFEEEKHPARIVYLSTDFDLAILKIDAPTPVVFQLSTSADLPRAKKVYACGFPGAAQTVVSEEEMMQKEASAKKVFPKVERYFNKRDFIFSLQEGPVSRVFEEESKRRWIQHGASILHGYSGGPLMTEDGTVVGINTRIAEAGVSKEFQIAPGIGYSLTMPQLRKEIDKVVAGVRWK